MATRVLGERVAAPRTYSPDILEAIPRGPAREDAGIDGQQGQGADVWHLYELSWLGPSGVPTSYCGALKIPATSAATVESKSLKLYLNSLNFHTFDSDEVAINQIIHDVGQVCHSAVELHLVAPAALAGWTRAPRGECIDTEIATAPCGAEPGISGEPVAETLHTQLLRSLCPVTGQPDWATLEVEYRGPRINRASLLGYVLSFREHQDFHEQCIEQIYATVNRCCTPDHLSVRGFYLRRGGIDITPHRASASSAASLERMSQQ